LCGLTATEGDTIARLPRELTRKTSAAYITQCLSERMRCELLVAEQNYPNSKSSKKATRAWSWLFYRML